MSDSHRDDLRPEYPPELIRSGQRGEYAAHDREGTDVVLIDPELHRQDPDSDAVNRALREHLAEHSGGAA